MLKNFSRKICNSLFKTNLSSTYKHNFQSNNYLADLRQAFSISSPFLFSCVQRRHRTRTSSPFVKHNKRENYFYIDVPGCKAILEYERALQIVRIISTDVPENCSGKGYGRTLAEAALNWIAENDLRVVIDCEFVQDYVMNKKPEYQKYVIQKK